MPARLKVAPLQPLPATARLRNQYGGAIKNALDDRPSLAARPQRFRWSIFKDETRMTARNVNCSNSFAHYARSREVHHEERITAWYSVGFVLREHDGEISSFTIG